MTVDQLLEVRADVGLPMSPDESLQTAIRLALVCPLRLHALTGRGPQTVEHLLHRQIHEASSTP